MQLPIQPPSLVTKTRAIIIVALQPFVGRLHTL
jgi:hypothetical protein